jgi:AcrR family transcriptional regulator
MPKVSEDYLAARRSEILEGARRAFAKHGYEGATVARLEEEIGLSRGAIFHYFDSKLDLFVAIAAADNLRYQQVLAEEGVEAVVRTVAATDRSWLSVLVETEVRLWHDPELERRMEAAAEEDTVLAGLTRAQREGKLRTDIDPSALLEFVMIVLNGMAVRVVSGNQLDVDSLVRIVNDGLRAGDQAVPCSP